VLKQQNFHLYDLMFTLFITGAKLCEVTYGKCKISFGNDRDIVWAIKMFGF